MAINDNSFVNVTVKNISDESFTQVIPLELLWDFIISSGFVPLSTKEIIVTDLKDTLIRNET